MQAYNEKIALPSVPVRCFVRRSGELKDEVFVHPHWHEAVEVLYFVRGRARQQIGDRIFIARPEDIVVVWSDQIHSTYRLKEEDCVIGVYQFAHHGLWENELVRRIGFTGPVGAGHPLWETLRGPLRNIAAELEGKGDGYEHQVMADVHRFYAAVIRNRERLPVALARPRGGRDTVRRLFAHIDAHYAEPLSLRSAAAAAYLSVPQLTRVVRGATGMTFKTYLDLYRVDRAAALLRQGCTVAETAARCGFGSAGTFIRVFRRIKKCTPSFYREK